MQDQLNTHIARTDNPHSVTAGQVGLGLVDDIQQSIANHRTLISVIRRLRLVGKKAIREAPADQIKNKHKTYAKELEKLRAKPNY